MIPWPLLSILIPLLILFATLIGLLKKYVDATPSLEAGLATTFCVTLVLGFSWYTKKFKKEDPEKTAREEGEPAMPKAWEKVFEP